MYKIDSLSTLFCPYLGIFRKKSITRCAIFMVLGDVSTNSTNLHEITYKSGDGTGSIGLAARKKNLKKPQIHDLLAGISQFADYDIPKSTFRRIASSLSSSCQHRPVRNDFELSQPPLEKTGREGRFFNYAA